MAYCGRQMCFLPNECREVDGMSVCVRTDGPNCADMPCEAGYQCALLQDVCESLPCHPKGYCVKSSKYPHCDSAVKDAIIRGTLRGGQLRITCSCKWIRRDLLSTRIIIVPKSELTTLQ